jgi:serpin B
LSGKRNRAFGIICALAIGAVPMAARAAPADSGSKPLIAAYNGTGLRLFRAFAEKPANIVLSPYSIGAAMAMTLAGARGENAAEMAKVLGLDLAPERINDANATVLKSLNSVPSASFQLDVANAVMLTKQAAAVSQAYIALLRDKYAAQVFHGADLATVNDWVKQRTHGKIDSILDSLDPSTALVLLDAIYFKARWQMGFPSVATHPEPFHLLNGEAAVPMMHDRDDFVLAQRPGYRAIRLPYAGGRVSMIVLLPDADVVDTVRRFDESELEALLAVLHLPPGPVELSLPRFHASFSANLTAPFTAMGMHRAFSAAAADFSGITGKPQSQEPLAIDQIEHRAVIDVNEQGTEAAAATGVTMAATAVEPPPATSFRVDRPFLYMIVDDQTGAVLFEGEIVDPRQSS